MGSDFGKRDGKTGGFELINFSELSLFYLRYYQAKFEVSENDIEFRRNVACSYVEGLCWVLRYYYQVSVSVPNLVSPFIYFYIRVVQVGRGISRITMPHLLPILILLATLSPIFSKTQSHLSHLSN